jgi:protein gp37
VTRTKIEWCDYTWNPVVGCTGSCPYCYARKMATRFHRDFTPHWVQRNFERAFPRQPSMIFVNSMSDVADWEDGWSLRVFGRIDEHPEHLFLFLTKRPEAMKCVPRKNVLFGVSVTDQRSYDRLISKIGPHNFLSIEPISGPIKLWGLHSWLIVGAETGNRKGKVQPALSWLFEIENYARANKIPLFFKESLREQLDDGYYGFPQEYPVIRSDGEVT